MFSLPILEDQLAHYVNGSSASAFANPFDFSKVPVVTREQSLAEDRTKKLTTATPTLKAPSVGPKKSDSTMAAEAAANATVVTQRYAQQLSAIPEFAAYGGVLKSSPVIELTEPETEYVVAAVKHLFNEHLVLQFNVKNTLADYILTDVSILCNPSSEDEDAPTFEDDGFLIPVPVLKPEEPASVYVSFSRPDSTSFVSTSFTNVLKFTLKEIDPSTGEPEASGYDDEYQVEDLDVTAADYILPAFAGSFDNVWSGLPADSEASETLQLSNVKGIADAVESLVKALGMQPLEGSEVALSTSTHTLRVYGKSVAGGKVAASVRMAYSAKSGVTVKITARSEEDGLAEMVVGGVA
jgi:coatomer protein complex subunit gamma